MKYNVKLFSMIIGWLRDVWLKTQTHGGSSTPKGKSNLLS